MTTLQQLVDLSKIISGDDVTEDQLESAKDQFVAHMREISEDEHMRLCIDLVASLELRDLVRYGALMQSLSYHRLTELLDIQQGEAEGK